VSQRVGPMTWTATAGSERAMILRSQRDQRLAGSGSRAAECTLPVSEARAPSHMRQARVAAGPSLGQLRSGLQRGVQGTG
jgi:hypothetical protein